MSVADEIKARLDIVTYIQQYVPLKKAGRTYKACCPFHQEKTPSFVVDPVRQTWRCYGSCATGGDVLNFAMRQHGWTFTEALRELARTTGVQLKARTPEQLQTDDRHEFLRGLLHSAAEQFHRWLIQPDTAPGPHAQAARSVLDYARGKRALSDETLIKFQIGFAPPEWSGLLTTMKQIGYTEDDLIEAGMAVRNDAGRVYDRFRNRLMIPIRDDRGRVIGFGARALDPNDNPKYLNTPETPIFNKSRTLFALDTAKGAIRDSGAVVIVEGYLDAIQAQQAGYGNVVAQMGTALTDAQLQLVAPRYAQRVLLALDSDAAGQNATMRSLEVARRALSQDYAGRMQIDMRVLSIPGAKDPDDLIREQPDLWPQIVDQARPVADFVIEFETRDLSPNATIVEKEAAARRILPLLMASERELYRQDNLQKLAAHLRVAEKTLITWAASQPAEPRAARRPPAQPAPRELTPPPEYDEFGDPIAVDIGIDDAPPAVQPAPRLPAPQDELALERYCLRRLIEQPAWVYAANQRLRTLSEDNAALSDGPLCDLTEEDFLDSTHRSIWSAIREALHSAQAEPGTHIEARLDADSVDVLIGLRVSDAVHVRASIKERLDGDAAVLWDELSKRAAPAFDAKEDLVVAVLRLRAARISRDRESLTVLLAESESDGGETRRLMVSLNVLAQAVRQLDAELSRRIR
ncbi:MAG: DNA primase [Chloroflexi bacterium]|nr:MAG: DNA primase [Chloroflexota bacterium]